MGNEVFKVNTQNVWPTSENGSDSWSHFHRDRGRLGVINSSMLRGSKTKEAGTFSSFHFKSSCQAVKEFISSWLLPTEKHKKSWEFFRWHENSGCHCIFQVFIMLSMWNLSVNEIPGASLHLLIGFLHIMSIIEFHIMWNEMPSSPFESLNWEPTML